MQPSLVQRLRDSVTQCRALDRSQLLTEAADEIERLRITDDEKKAIESALGWCDDRDTKTISTLNGLLKRLK